ncbi:MAG TPA: response regulator transcription factor [Candidatus Aquilonibacter sp.]|nr:response regulator transcription factor [Candidatus Aquilonibacter sp.]
MSHPTDAAKFPFAGTKIRCVLAHEQLLVRQGLRRLLEDESDINVVSEAGEAAECLRQIYALRPDVVIADARTFTASDAELCVSPHSSRPKFVFLSTEDELRFAIHPDRAKAKGCDVRQTSAEELVQMVRSACGDRKTASQPRAEENPPNGETVVSQPSLTAREEEVLKLLAEGKTVRNAATVLGLSSKTVDSHKFNLMRKLGIHNKAELVMWAVQKKLVKIPPRL